MKSVGEVLGLGRTFAESLQKALRSMETELTGLNDVALDGLGQGDDKNVIREALGRPAPDRILKVAQALRLGFDAEQIYAPARSTRGSSRRSRRSWNGRTASAPTACRQTERSMRALKSMGFSDKRLATLTGKTDARSRQRTPRAGRGAGLQAHRHLRRRVPLADALHVFDLRKRP